MSALANSTTALLTEHLRHTPVSLIDDIINSINEIGYKAIDWLEQSLSAASPAALGFPPPLKGPPGGPPGGGDSSTSSSEAAARQDAAVRHEIENGVHQFETLLEAAIDRNFDKMEVFALRSCLRVEEGVRDWVRLRHYDGLKLEPRGEDEATVESVMLLRGKVQESMRLHRLLEAEVARNSRLIDELRAVTSMAGTKTEMQKEVKKEDVGEEKEQNSKASLAFLSQTGDLNQSSKTTPLTTTTHFALSQLPAMRALVSDLRPQLSALSTPPPPSDPNLATEGSASSVAQQESWRQQRIRHVETLTKRFLVNDQGLELGEQGGVRDGEWQAPGVAVVAGDVEALEGVLGIVGAGAEGGEGEGEMMVE